MTTPTWTPEELAAWTEKQKHDARAIRDRACSACGEPITRYSESGMCNRCSRHATLREKKKQVRKAGPSDAQRIVIRKSRARMDVTKRSVRLDPCAVSTTGAHHWVIEMPIDGEQSGTCRACGATKSWRPWDDEGTWKKEPPL